MYYVFTTKTAAEDYIEAVDKVSEFRPPTKTWATVKKHPTKNKYAVAANTNLPLKGKRAVKLSEDWYDVV